MMMLAATYTLARIFLMFLGVQSSLLGSAGRFDWRVFGEISVRFTKMKSWQDCPGLSNVQIMHEIVIPAGRPGLLNLLNRTKQRFRRIQMLKIKGLKNSMVNKFVDGVTWKSSAVKQS